MSKANHNLSRLLDKPGAAGLTVFFIIKKIAFRRVWGIAAALLLDVSKTGPNRRQGGDFLWKIRY